MYRSTKHYTLTKSTMTYEPEFCDGEMEGSLASMTDAEYQEWKRGQYRLDAEAYTEEDARQDEVQANHLTDAKLGLI